MSLGQMLEKPSVTQEEVEAYLDGLSHAERIRECTALNKGQQDRLWEIAGVANKPIDQSFLVDAEAPVLEPHPFEGRNSLPAFTRFRKVFYRTEGGEIAGYNNNSIEKVIGPGYFVVEDSPAGPGAVMINYLRIPNEKPAGWPEIRKNEEGLSKFVYNGTQDFLRYVSKHVAIGRAFRNKGGTITPMPNWFVLCRKAD
jgi:hypothetical protein